jgi:3-deoxy-D-manno-octulosonic-acid transferase
MPQSREDEKKLRGLGARNIKYIGNLKYGANPLPFDQERMAELQKAVGGRMVWLAASTHPGEEEKILAAHLKIKEKNYSVLTIIVPRAPWRGAEIRDLCGDGVNVALRSQNQPILDDTDIYVADTMGELGIFYRLAPIVFIGGSFVERGGHNPIEPAHLDNAIICGNNMQNFAEIVEEFEKAGAIQLVEDENELAFRVFELWQNPQKRTAMARLAAKLVRSRQEILHNIIDEIEKFV